mgnify:CR=1 FL=1
MAKGYSARRGFTGGAGMMQQQAQMQQKLLKMQQDMAKAQEEVEKTEFTASVGGGAVTAVVTGKKELTKLTIKPDVIDPEDAEMLQDLVISAVNEALRQADDAMNSSMSWYSRLGKCASPCGPESVQVVRFRDALPTESGVASNALIGRVSARRRAISSFAENGFTR